MTTEHPRTVIIKGRRFTARRELEHNPRAMSEVAQELIEAADFQLTCLPKIVRVAQDFELITTQDHHADGIWTSIVGVMCIDEESTGRAEIIEV